MTGRPDIVLLVLDIQRADRLSCYGCPIETSPHLDTLAAESTLFAHAVAPAQWTIPAHASIFTGLYPSQHGMLQGNSTLPATLPTLVERLRQADYYTAGFSNNPLIGVLNNGLQRGFDGFLNYGGLLNFHSIQDDIIVSLPSRKSWLFRSLSCVQRTLAHSRAVNALISSPILARLRRAVLSVRGNLKGNTTQSLNDAARLLVERQGTASGQPVIVFINLMGTHVPFVPPRWAVERCAPHLLRSRSLTCLEHFSASIYDKPGPLPDALDTDRKMILDGLYDSEVAAQDEQVGLFIRKLREEDVLDHTLLIIVSDHGEHLGEKQLLGHEFGAYEDLIHVPLLIRDPTGNLPRGATLTSFVSTRRLFHTILTVAGVATSAEEALTLFNVCGPRVGAEAEQETPLAEAESLQEALHRLERRCPGSQKHWIQPRRAVYNGNYKLISIGERDFELYHIQDDPNENVNLSQSLPMMVEQLRQCLPGHTQVTNPTADVTLHQNDPIVLQRLRALGYLE